MTYQHILRHPREYIPMTLTAPPPPLAKMTLGLPADHSFNKKSSGKSAISDITARKIIEAAIWRFVLSNDGARLFVRAMAEMKKEIVADHVTVRTHNVPLANKYFEAMGYVVDPAERLDYKDAGWWAQVLRKPGFPAAFVDQTYDEETDESKQIVKKWVDTFGDPMRTWGSLSQTDPKYATERYTDFGAQISFHHIAVRVPDIEAAIKELKVKGVDFADNKVTAEEEEINGKTTKLLLQIFTKPQSVSINAMAHNFSVLEIIERRIDLRTNEIYPYFRRRQADDLMKSTQ